MNATVEIVPPTAPSAIMITSPGAASMYAVRSLTILTMPKSS
ncbi:MAG: hypothetical protein U9N46_02200 [Euryarchaeota archaeon]|nr:hypothetical protein [Euryarchaeota archaeon]